MKWLLQRKRERKWISLTEAEFHAEIEKGYADYLAGKGRPAEEVFSDILEGLNT